MKTTNSVATFLNDLSQTGQQQKGPILFLPSSILNNKLTPIKRGEAITLRPKVRFINPNDAFSPQWRFRGACRVKFTREQRISAAKQKALV